MNKYTNSTRLFFVCRCIAHRPYVVFKIRVGSARLMDMIYFYNTEHTTFHALIFLLVPRAVVECTKDEGADDTQKGKICKAI